MSKKQKQDEAVKSLIEKGCELVKKEDRFGETKSCWWLDDVYLGPKSDPCFCLEVIK